LGYEYRRMLTCVSSKTRSHDVVGVSREGKKTILAACEKDGASVEALKGGSRRGRLPGLRVQLAKDLVENHGLTMAETARQLGVTTSAISRIFERNK
jgi:putative transposase